MKQIPIPDLPVHCVINAQGTLAQAISASVPVDELLRAYRNMVLIRQFDKKAVALQRTGQLGTYASSLGQEAISTAIGLSMRDQDVFAPYYRDTAAQYLRGVPLHKLLAYWGGDETGNHFGEFASQDLPNCVPIATQLSHAAGIATAVKIRAEKRAVVVTCGDGATSRGDFYESINLAGVWQLPLVVVVNNNQWAISVPRHLQTAAPTIAHKAYAAGIPCQRVDGNDAAAMLEVMHAALERAYCGKGATLIEAISYRLCDHTTADDATRYRSSDELNHAWENEPIKRLQTWLHQNGHWNEEKEKALFAECASIIDAEVDRYLQLPSQIPEDFFDYLFDDVPWAMQAQRQQFIERFHQRGGAQHGR
ncbi:Probable pyruvate dehydrogenase E1 component, alpha subunit [gamma proteobacterium HdN1]|nr:Probable pyruvate dehydrogenase E1 component, alpha subunit [gamma proteobacterium HdN1]